MGTGRHVDGGTEPREDRHVGSWGTGLYSDDIAVDLRSTLVSVLRLPLEPDEILATLRKQEPSLDDPDDGSHCDCWFVVADRFHRYGITHSETVDRVTGLIDRGVDLRVKGELGMSASDLRRRSKVLDGLRERIQSPHPRPFQRGSVKRPQRFVVEPGELLAFPVANGRSANPYFPDWASQRFKPDAYAAALVVNHGRAFGFLAWYSAVMLDATWPAAPPAEACHPMQVGELRFGTLTATRVRRLAVEVVARLRLRPDAEERIREATVSRLRSISPRAAARHVAEEATAGDRVAISDISLSNHLAVPRRRPNGRSDLDGMPLVSDLIESGTS